MTNTTEPTDPFGAPVQDEDENIIALGLDPKQAFVPTEEKLPSPGVHACRCLDAKRTNSKSSGNPMLVLTYAIHDNPEFVDTEFKDYNIYSVKSMKRMGYLYKAFGIEAEGKVSVKADAFIGKIVSLELFIEVGEWEGRETKQIRVKRTLPLEKKTVPFG